MEPVTTFMALEMLSYMFQPYSFILGFDAFLCKNFSEISGLGQMRVVTNWNIEHRTDFSVFWTKFFVARDIFLLYVINEIQMFTMVKKIIGKIHVRKHVVEYSIRLVWKLKFCQWLIYLKWYWRGTHTSSVYSQTGREQHFPTTFWFVASKGRRSI